MKIVLNGETWHYSEPKYLGTSGDGKEILGRYHTQDPKAQGRNTIKIRRGLSGQERMDTLIHELLHACALWASEDWVGQTATEMAAVLWRLGYRDGNST